MKAKWIQDRMTRFGEWCFVQHTRRRLERRVFFSKCSLRFAVIVLIYNPVRLISKTIFNFGIALVHLLLLLLQIVSDHWLELWECTALALCQRWKPQSSAQDSEIGLGAHSLEALGPSCTHWPKPTQPSAASTRHSQLCSGPSSLWPPCTFTSCAFLAPAARCACVCCSPSPYPLISLDLLLLPFLISPRSLTSRFPICPLTVSASSVWVVCLFVFFPLNSLCLSSFPSLARHRGCNSAQQLLSWHVLHCLLTVLFLLDFIKTPSAISAGMVEEVVEEEMEEEGDGRKVRDLAAESEANGWTHMESAGCHGGLLSEGHRQYTRRRKLN